MEKLVLVVHVLTALSIIALILLQQGKGAEAGASFGAGASQTVFGSQGSGNFFSRLTAVMATVFFVTSIGLALLAKRGSDGAVDADLPQVPAAVEQKAPAATPGVDSDVPQLEDSKPAGNDVPSAEDVPSTEDVPAAEAPQPGADEGTDTDTEKKSDNGEPQ